MSGRGAAIDGGGAGAADDLAVREAGPEDTDAIVDLLRVALGTGKIPRDRAYWAWKHEQNPFGASPCLVAVADDGRVVGVRAFLRWRWRAGGRGVRAVRAVDTATHPEFRGRGVFKRLTLALLERMRAEGVAFCFNTPNAKSRPGYLKMGWEELGRLRFWARPLVPGRLGGLWRATGDDGSGGRAGDDVAAVLAVPGLEAFLGGLAAGAGSAGGRYWTPRDRGYLDWRYRAIRGFRYRAAADLDGGEGALLVWRVGRRRGLRELLLSEVLVTPSLRGVRRAGRLLRRVCFRAGADYAAAAAPWRSPEAVALGLAGFGPTPRLGPIVTVREVTPGPDWAQARAWTGWRFAVGDLEIF